MKRTKTIKNHKKNINVLKMNSKVLALINFKRLEKAIKLPQDVILKIIKIQWIVNIIDHVPKINLFHNRKLIANIEPFIGLIIKLYYHHGHAGTIIKLKALKLNMQQYCLDQNVQRIPYCASDKDNVAKIIRWLKPNLGDHDDVRYSMSILRVLDTFKGPINIDTKSITDPSDANEETIKDILLFIKRCNLLKDIKVLPGYLPLSNKAGPNGPCTLACLADLSAIKGLKNKKVYQAVRVQIKETLNWLNMDGHDTHEGKVYDAVTIGLQDKFDKTRPVSILDFWSNVALSGIHKTFMNALSKIKNDVTFSQSKIPDYIKNLGFEIYSSDMTAFTDRFPRIIEQAVIAEIFDAETANRWNTIIADRDFVINKNTDSEVKVRYEVGNPMGVLSSWPVSTLAHHVIKHYCMYKTNTKKYRYLILGDDTIDSSKKVHNYYLETIKKLGVKISQAKCTSSKNGSGEFAKRLYRKHIEVTGIPVDLLTNISEQPENYIELARLAEERGYKRSNITRGIINLLSVSPNKDQLTVSDQLALPINITGRAPILELRPGSYAEILSKLSLVDQKIYLQIARDRIFFSEANKISLVINNPNQNFVKSKFPIKQNHPLVFAISQQIEPFLGVNEIDESAIEDWSNVELEEYSIFNAWCKGDYRNLCRIPSIDGYKYRTKGHKVTKARYLVQQKMLEMVNSNNCNDFLCKNQVLSDYTLYDLGYDQLRNSITD